MREIGSKEVQQNESILQKLANVYETPDETEGDCKRITRSMSKLLNSVDTKNCTIVEVYRSMPLLGDEYNIPNWQVHFIKYSIEFVKK